ISRNIDAELTLAALRVAIKERRPPKGCIHHSDRGVQYAADDYVKELKAAGLIPSMAAKGNPYDNAAAESFMKTLIYDEVYLWDYRTMDDVLQRVPYFLEEVYNKKRLHSALGYLSPDRFEARQRKNQLKLDAEQPTSEAVCVQ
ncbi:MAG: DDE-type integrase/transposase/recombinase, partial [Elusimicrobia bacterium]|nr:DDE-type integrase/transposase/recombinase [Elusimicrobiota bacterium]